MIFLFLLLIAPAVVIAMGLLLFQNAVVTFILFYGGVCLAIPFTDILGRRGLSLREALKLMGFTRWSENRLLSLSAGTLTCIVVYLFFASFKTGLMDAESVRILLARWGIGRADAIWFIPVMVIMNSFAEEMYWRGYLLNRLIERSGRNIALILTAVFYASYHGLTTGILFSPVYAAVSTSAIAAAGLLWGYMRLARKSIWFSVITHLMADLGIMFAYVKYISR